MRNLLTLILSIVVALAAVQFVEAQQPCPGGVCYPRQQPQQQPYQQPAYSPQQSQPYYAPLRWNRVSRPVIGPDGQLYMLHVRGYFRGFGPFGQRVWEKQ